MKETAACLMCGRGPGGDEPPGSALPFGLRPGHPFTVHFTPTFSKDASSLSADPATYNYLLTCSETAMRLAAALDDCYVACVTEDGACAACFLLRASLRLEGEGWELGQEFSSAVHGARCTHRGPKDGTP